MKHIDKLGRKLAIYARLSTDSEGESKSIEEQVHYCRLAASRLGFRDDQIEVFEEPEGLKGEWHWLRRRKGERIRPVLAQLVQAIENDEFTILMIWDSDRLYRSTGVSNDLFEVLLEHQARLFILGNELDISTAAGRLQANVGAAINQHYKDQTSERVQRTQAYRLENDEFSHNPNCYGLKSVGKQRVEPQWDRVAVVNRIFTMFVTGENGEGPLTINGIAMKLQDEGVSLAAERKGPKPKNISRVKFDSVKRILTNPVYAGRWRHKGQEKPYEKLLFAHPETGVVGPLVPPALFEAAQDKLARSQPRGVKSHSSMHMLSGLVACAYCGINMVTGKRDAKATGAHAVRFLCRYGPKTVPDCIRGSCCEVSEGILNDWVLHSLAPILAAQLEERRASADHASLQQQLADLQHQLSKALEVETVTLTRALASGVWDDVQGRAVAKRLQAERERLERLVLAVERELNRLSANLPELDWSTVRDQPVAAIKDALTACLQFIAVGTAGICVLTRWGTYIAAKFFEVDPPRGSGMPRRRIAEPTPDAAGECLEWFANPEKFVRGRRQCLKEKADLMTDAEILPGLFPANSIQFGPDQSQSDLPE